MMKNSMKLIILTFFLLSIFSTLTKASVVWQDTASATSCSGTWKTGYECAKVYDDNWATNGKANDVIETTCYAYMNYTTYANANSSSIISYKAPPGGATTNFTIGNSGCWNSSVIMTRCYAYDDGGGTSLFRWDCWNYTSAAWVQLAAQSGTAGCFDSGIYWNVTVANNPPVVSARVIDPASPVYNTNDVTINATCYDVDAGNTITAYWNVYKNNADMSLSGSLVVTNNTNTLLTTLGKGNFSGGDTVIGEIWCGDGTANTTKGNTSTATYQKASTPLTLANNLTWSGTYPAPSNTTGSDSITQLTFTLYRNDTGSLGTGNPKSDLVQLGAGAYNYTYNTSGNANYSANSTSNILVIGKSNSLTYNWVLSSPITYGTASDFQMDETVSGDGGCTYTLYRNGTSIGTGSSVSDTTVLNAGVWNYTYARDSCANYSSASVEKDLTISKATPLIPLTLDGSDATPQTRTYPNNTHFLISEVNTGASDCQYVMRINNTPQISHDFSRQLGAGVYNITGAIEVACENYTTNSSTIILTISKGTPTGLITLLPSSTVTYPTETTASCSLTTGDSGTTLTLKRDTVTKATGTAPSEIITLGYKAGGYSYTCDYPSTENYSATTLDTQVLTVDKGSQSISLTGITNNTYPYSVTPVCSGNVTSNLYMNGSVAVNDTAIQLGAGVYLWICNTTDDANYTFATTSVLQIVSQATRTCTLATDKLWTRDYDGTASSTSCSVSAGSTDGTMTFTRNATPISTPNLQTNSGAFGYACKWTGGANYSDCVQQTDILTINKIASTCALTSSEGWTFTYPLSTFLNCSCSGDGTTHLYFNDVEHDAYNGTSIGFSANTTGYPVVCNITEGANYNSDSDSNTLIIDKATPVTYQYLYPNPATYGSFYGIHDNMTIPDGYGTFPQFDTYINDTLYSNSTGLVAYWRFNEISLPQNFATDSSGNRNHGTLIDMNIYGNSTASGWVVAPPPVCRFGDCMRFDGANDRITILDSNSLDITDAITITAWIYTEGTSGAYPPIVIKDNAYLLSFDEANQGRIGFWIYNGTQWSAEVTTASNYTQLKDKWVFIVATFDSATHLMSNYENGVLTGTAILDGNINTDSSPVEMGGTALYGGGYFNGTMDDVRIYNRALTDGDVMKLWQMGNGYDALAVGPYNITTNLTGNENYTSTSDSELFTINQGSVPLTLSNNISWNGTYPSPSNTTGLGCPSGVTCGLFRNGSSVSNPNIILLGVGVYNYTFNTTGNENYTANSTSSNLTINKNTTKFLSLTNNISWSGVYPSSTNTTGFNCPSGVTCTLYRNGTSIGTGSPRSDLVLLGVGIYNYTYNFSDTTNYTYYSNSSNLTISASSTNPVHLITTLTNFTTNYTDTNISFWVGRADFFGYLGISGSGTASLYVDGINVTNPYGRIFTTGTYLIKVNTSGNANYSANSTGLTQSIVVAEISGGDGGSTYPSGGPFGSPLSTYTNTTNATNTSINTSANTTPENNSIIVINYPTRLAQVTGETISGKPFDAFLYLIQSLGDYYYRWGDAGILDLFLFRHITFVILFALILDLVIRYSKIIKKSKGIVKFLIYFIIVPLIGIFISLMLPSV